VTGWEDSLKNVLHCL